MIATLMQLTVLLQCDGVSTVGSLQSASRVTVELNGAEGRIMPPRELIPELAGRGDQGWRQLTDLDVSDERVRGRFSFNWINKPVVVIDRRTGDIEIQGQDAAGGGGFFRGDCRAVTQERVF